jgi:glycosyltransferase involved in cell wall biosynthesis
MIPLYAVVAAPPVKARRARLLLWFTHWRLSPTLRLAERLCDAVLSVDRRSFPLDSRKLVAIGHGIDLAAFACRDGRSAADGELRALVLGRYSEAKGLPTLLRAAALEPRVRVAVHGPTLNEAERQHRRELEALAAELELGGRVELGGAVAPERARALLAEADVLVNNMRAGAADKVVLEACASCVPVLASDPGWAETLDGLELPLRFGREEPEELAARLAALAAADGETRARLGGALRERVARRHSVESWARGVVETAARGRVGGCPRPDRRGSG